MHYRVLIVDDEPDVLDVLKEMLGKLGFESSCVENGVKAVEIIKSNSFDLIISDLIMPGKNGLEILQETRKINKSIPFIITAGVDLEDTDIEPVQYQFNEFIKKPFTFEDIKLKIDKCIKLNKNTISRKCKCKS